MDPSRAARTLAVVAVSGLVAWLGSPSGRGLEISSSRAELGRGNPWFFHATLEPPVLEVVARAPTGVQPKSCTAAPDGSVVAVCNFGRPDRENVTLHDPETLERVGVISFPGNAVESIFSPDNRTLYVSNFRRHVIEVIDVESRTVTREIAAGEHPKTMALSPDGALLYVANYAGRSVSVIELETGRELRRLRTGVHPRGMVVRPSGRLLVASFDSHFVQEFSPGGERELRRFPTCQFPRHLVLAPQPLRLLISCTLGSVAFYDLPTGRPFGLAGVGVNPRSMDVSDDGRWIATADFGLGDNRRGSVSLIDTRRRTQSTTLVRRAERFVGLSIGPGDDPIVYATSWDSDELIAFRRARSSGPP